MEILESMQSKFTWQSLLKIRRFQQSLPLSPNCFVINHLPGDQSPEILQRPRPGYRVSVSHVDQQLLRLIFILKLQPLIFFSTNHSVARALIIFTRACTTTNNNHYELNLTFAQFFLSFAFLVTKSLFVQSSKVCLDFPSMTKIPVLNQKRVCDFYELIIFYFTAAF